MSPFPMSRLRWLAALATLMLVLGGCSDDGDSGVDASGGGTEQTDGEEGDGATDGEAGAGDEGSGATEGGGDGTTPDGGAPSGGGDGGQSGSGQSGGGAPATTPAGGAAAGGQQAAPTSQPPAAGSYHYTVDGTAKQGTNEEQLPDQTLEIASPDGGRQSQVQTADDGSSRQELVLEYKADGVYLHEATVSQSGLVKSWKFSPAQLAFPPTAAPGTKWAWSGTSTDGKTKLEASFEITGAEQVTVGGQPVDTITIHAVTTTSGDLQSTSDETWWLSPQHRLVVKTAGTTSGSFGPFTFSSQSTSVLDSLQPA